MSTYWLGLGANLGDRAAALAWAVRRLEDDGVVVEAVSPLYETAPQGVEDQPAFINGACRVRTDLDPPALLALAKALEAEAGRVQATRWGPRPLDIDLLAWSGGAFHGSNPDLDIPHPRLAERRFALVPLADLAPDLPIGDGRTVLQALATLDADDQPVTPVVDAPRL